MLSPPVKQIIMPVQPLILKNPCFKHNKEADYFCEMDNCYERLCIDCRISHPITHASKILPFNAAVQKYIEVNPLQSTFQRINSSLSTDIKGKVQQMQGKYREEIQKAGNELKKQALVAIDQALNKWTQEVSQRLNNTSRDADMIYQQLKGEEKQLLDGQQRYKQSVDNFVYLQMIAKQQQISEKSIQSISDNLARVKGDVERLSKIDQIFLNTFNSVFSFTKNLQSSLDGFFKDLLLNEPMELQIKNVPEIGIYAETPNNRPVVNQIRLQSPQQQQLIRYQFPVAQSPQYVQNVNRQQPQFVNQFQVGKQPGRAVSSDQKAQQQVKKDLQGDIPESVQISPVKEFYSAPGILQDLIFIDSSKNKKLLIASQSDGKIIKVQLHNEERSEIQLTDLKIKSAIYIRSLKKIVCGCQDGRVFLFDPFNMKIVDTPFKESQNSPILCLIYIEKKQQLFTGSQDGQVVLWNLEKKSLERVFQRMHLGEVKGIITNFIDEHLITVGSDKNIIVTEISTNKTLFKVPNAHNSFITAIVKVKENSFFTAGADGFVKLWEWRDKEICLIGQAKLHASPITFLGFLDKYNLLITSSEDGQLHLTDPINYQQVVSALPKGLKGGAKGVHWVSPHLFSSDAFSLLKWENPKLTQCMAMVLKSRKQSQNSNCSIF